MRQCLTSRTFAKRPRRFKFTIRLDVGLNHTVYTGIFHINGLLVFHVVDEGTYFQEVEWRPVVFPSFIWHALYRCWIYVYIDQQDMVAHDARKIFLACIFAANCKMLHTLTKIISFGSIILMSVNELYYDPIWCV